MGIQKAMFDISLYFPEFQATIGSDLARLVRVSPDEGYMKCRL